MQKSSTSWAIRPTRVGHDWTEEISVNNYLIIIVVFTGYVSALVPPQDVSNGIPTQQQEAGKFIALLARYYLIIVVCYHIQSTAKST